MSQQTKHFQLPLSHPEYRYPEAKNIYAKRLETFPGQVYSDSASENFPGHWRTEFAKLTHQTSTEAAARFLHVEIGCNTGHVTRAWAKRDPENFYVGIDWKFKAIHNGLEKAKKGGLQNLIFLRANAWRFQYIFGPSEIDRISIFCPDPWPKKSQWKNRHLQTETLELLRTRLKPGGILHIKTDHEGYFDWILEHLAPLRALWIVESETRHLHEKHPNPHTLDIPEVTLFEKLFIKDGIPIKQIILKKPGENL